MQPNNRQQYFLELGYGIHKKKKLISAEFYLYHFPDITSISDFPPVMDWILNCELNKIFLL